MSSLKELVVYRERLGEYGLAIAEAGLVEIGGTTPTGKTKPIYFFSRINVPDKYCGNGVGSKLLDKLLHYMKENDCALICGINPYGRLSYEELEAWYIRHGMRYYDRGLEYDNLWYNA